MNKNTKNPDKTILTITVGFLTLFLITGMRWTIFVSFFVGLAGVFSDYLANKIDFIWNKLTWVLGLLIPNVILSIIFYCILFPIAFLSKTFGNKNPLNLKNESKTLFVDVKRKFTIDSLKNPW